jgi:hypothetical protein
VKMGVFVLSVASYFNYMFCGVSLLCKSLKWQVWWFLFASFQLFWKWQTL